MVGLIAAIMSIILGALAFLWADRIDYMNEKHPDYKGEDFLSENQDDLNK